MARYTGPRQRVQRALGVTLSGLTRKPLERRPYPPGQHGLARTRRRRESEYATRLREKQKLRFYYGLRERQLLRYVRRAARIAGRTDLNLLARLELRVDNVVFRLGLAPTIPAARQLVSHGHVLVNGHRHRAPARELREGDVVEVREKSRERPPIVQAAQHGPELATPKYLERLADGRLGGKVIARPERSDVPIDLNESMVVEYYARA